MTAGCGVVVIQFEANFHLTLYYTRIGCERDRRYTKWVRANLYTEMENIWATIINGPLINGFCGTRLELGLKSCHMHQKCQHRKHFFPPTSGSRYLYTSAYVYTRIETSLTQKNKGPNSTNDYRWAFRWGRGG